MRRLSLVLVFTVGALLGPAAVEWGGRARAQDATPGTATPAPVELRGRAERPRFDSTWTAIVRHILEPGAEVALDYAVAAELVLVERGRVVLMTDRPVEVVREGAGEAASPVAAETEVTLAAGDGAAIPAVSLVEFRNPGAEPASFILASIEEPGRPVSAPGYRWFVLAETGIAPGSFPVTLTLRRATLGPGEEVAAPAAGHLRLVASVEVIGDLSRVGFGYRNRSEAPLDVYLFSVEPFSSGTPTD